MKRLWILLIVVLAMLLAFTACAWEPDPAAEEEQPARQEEENTDADQPADEDVDTDSQTDADTDVDAAVDEVDAAEAAHVVADAVDRLNAGEPDEVKAAELRGLVFEYLPHIDWKTYGDWESDSTTQKMDLLNWLAEQEMTTDTEIKALFTLADDTDGAYTDTYAYSVTNTFLLGPRHFVQLMAEEEASVQRTLGLNIAYGAWQREDEVGAALQQLMAEDMSARELAALQQIAAGMTTITT